ncbi:AbiH family protein, partial [Acinetobacter baumannii]|uniref:AbiH family protein n=1 Tax=Acinetobacter baumannii TaxID=470 RepID=UPI0038B41D26
MDILIVGNGFDLSHFLPTKYDHFMEAMISIDNFQSSTEMKFDDIYKNLIENENYFFSKTKELYRCDLIKLDEDQVKIFKEKLQSNIWYKYFLEHVNDIKTWIDFEQKIDEALIYATKAIKNIEEKHLNSSSFNNPIYTTPSSNQVSYFFTEFQFNILTCLNFINEQPRAPNSRYRSGLLNKVYFKSETTEFYGFDSHKFLYFLQSELEKFIDIFNLYLLYIID